MADVHITSAIAFCRPEGTEALARLIAAAGHAEVARMDAASGRIVLLLERPSTKAVLDSLDAVRDLPGALAVHLVYQHAEDASVLEETP